MCYNFGETHTANAVCIADIFSNSHSTLGLAKTFLLMRADEEHCNKNPSGVETNELTSTKQIVQSPFFATGTPGV